MTNPLTTKPRRTRLSKIRRAHIVLLQIKLNRQYRKGKVAHAFVTYNRIKNLQKGK